MLAVRVLDQADKAALIASDEAVFFTEPHYNGFPAVLVRLPEIELDPAPGAHRGRVALHGAARAAGGMGAAMKRHD